MSPPRLLAVTVADRPDRWAAAGFALSDGERAEGSVRLGALTVLTGVGDAVDPAFVFDRPHPRGADSIDGIGWTVGTDAATGDACVADHPNGIVGTDHVVVMANHLGRIRDELVGAGFEIRRERPTSLGGAAITQLFAWAGDVLLEVVAPTEESPNDHVAARVWGLALVADDLDATAAWFGPHCSAPRPAVQAGRRIATVRHHDLGLTPTIAVMDRHVSRDR